MNAIMFASATRAHLNCESVSSSDEPMAEAGAMASLVANGAPNRENENSDEAAACGLRSARADSHSTCATGSATGSQSSAASAAGGADSGADGAGGATGPNSTHAASFEYDYSERVVAPSTPENNALKWLEYRGQRLAAFTVGGRDLLCLPQAFEGFLKHLVGGLHTVYTKLKRLEVTPVICNVEQVRLLRQVGAIQAGVNRCKLIAPSEFDILYDDCTNATCASHYCSLNTRSQHSRSNTRESFTSVLVYRQFELTL